MPRPEKRPIDENDTVLAVQLADARKHAPLYVSTAGTAVQQLLANGQFTRLVGTAFLNHSTKIRCTAEIEFDLETRSVNASLAMIAVTPAVVERIPS